MDQISPPMRIVLVVAIVFAAAWMLVLKPKDEPVPAAATPAPAAEAGGAEANTSLGKAVEGANEAAGAAETAQEARSGETESANTPSTSNTQAAGSQGAKAASGESSKPVDESLADLPKWLQKSMDEKVVAILFTNAESADDRRTSKALQRSYGDKQDVVTRVVNVAKISDYQAVTSGVDVSQSPTLLVIARDRSATASSGYATLETINQSIIDGLLVTDNPAERVPFLQKVQRECRTVTNTDMIGVTEGETPLGAKRNVEATVAALVDARAAVSKAPAPAAYKAQKAMTLQWMASEIAVGRSIIGSLGGTVINPIAINKIAGTNDKLASQTRLELNGVGVTTCN